MDAVQWINGLPLPCGATPRPELSGATSVGPGHNRVFDAYEFALPLEEARIFYMRHLSDAFTCAEFADEVVFSSATQQVKLQRRNVRTLALLIRSGL
jgi:hypothetical protein